VDALAVQAVHLLNALTDAFCREFAQLGLVEHEPKGDAAPNTTAIRARLWTKLTR